MINLLFNTVLFVSLVFFQTDSLQGSWGFNRTVTEADLARQRLNEVRSIIKEHESRIMKAQKKALAPHENHRFHKLVQRGDSLAIKGLVVAGEVLISGYVGGKVSEAIDSLACSGIGHSSPETARLIGRTIGCVGALAEGARTPIFNWLDAQACKATEELKKLHVQDQELARKNYEKVTIESEQVINRAVRSLCNVPNIYDYWSKHRYPADSVRLENGLKQCKQ